MFISPIQPMDLTSIQPIKPLEPKEWSGAEEASEARTASPFRDMVQGILDDMKTTEQQSVSGTAALATGTVDDLHTLGINNTKAYLAERLVIEVRNRALDAYSEIMRINV